MTDSRESAEGAGPGQVWRLPGIPALLIVSLTGFAGFASLLPVAPLWAVHGGANEAGSGLVNSFLLGSTIVTQLLVSSALKRFGWGPVLMVGMTLLGAPSLLLIFSDALGPILVVSAVRGIGFGILTVVGAAAVGLLVDAKRRGEAIGIYGLAIAVPNLFLLPVTPWISEQIGFPAVFVLGALPLVGILAAYRLGHAVHESTAAHLETEQSSESLPTGADWPAYRRLVTPVLVLLGVTLAGGGVLTFAPQMVSSSALTMAGLALMGLVAATARWRAGLLADNHGAERFIWPLVLITTIGMVAIAAAVRDPQETDVLTLLLGMSLLGLGYGGLQNLTLVISFNSVSRRHHNLASTIWNVGFDAGTGIGSALVGAAALYTSFPIAMLVCAVLSFLTLPLAIARSTPPRAPGRTSL